MIVNLKIGIGVAEFNIGNSIDGYLGEYDLEYIADVGYEVKDQGVCLQIEGGIIEAISCDQECLYKGCNLIGMTLDEFITHTGFKPEPKVDELDFEEDNSPQLIYEFDFQGLQVWVKNGKIVTIIISKSLENDNND